MSVNPLNVKNLQMPPHPAFWENLKNLSIPIEENTILLISSERYIHFIKLNQEPWYSKILVSIITFLGHFLYLYRLNKALDEAYEKFKEFFQVTRELSYKDSRKIFNHQKIIDNLKIISPKHSEKFSEIIFRDLPVKKPLAAVDIPNAAIVSILKREKFTIKPPQK
ncbi:MAG: hypothetical protein A3F40_00315 [Chlamydiae bacterium RIFCSPHIGHO2_12_FULL_27_8]|nr:MAG: hypothetical protein A3F40_00315 [Chlamydiae bacterium RIFCSPHIGHO2_12_FULL_27_8]